MKPTKLSELVQVLEFHSEDHLTRVDLQNGCVVTVERSVFCALEEGDEEALQQWFQYRDDAMKEFVVDWAEAKNIPYEDDLKK